MRFQIPRPVALGLTPATIDSVQSELLLEDARKRLICRDGFVRVMDLERLRMNLVHRDVNMFMLLLAMADGYVLMLA